MSGGPVSARTLITNISALRQLQPPYFETRASSLKGFSWITSLEWCIPNKGQSFALRPHPLLVSGHIRVTQEGLHLIIYGKCAKKKQVADWVSRIALEWYEQKKSPELIEWLPVGPPTTETATAETKTNKTLVLPPPPPPPQPLYPSYTAPSSASTAAFVTALAVAPKTTEKDAQKDVQKEKETLTATCTTASATVSLTASTTASTTGSTSASALNNMSVSNTAPVANSQPLHVQVDRIASSDTKHQPFVTPQETDGKYQSIQRGLGKYLAILGDLPFDVNAHGDVMIRCWPGHDTPTLTLEWSTYQAKPFIRCSKLILVPQVENWMSHPDEWRGRIYDMWQTVFFTLRKSDNSWPFTELPSEVLWWEKLRMICERYDLRAVERFDSNGVVILDSRGHVSTSDRAAPTATNAEELEKWVSQNKDWKLSGGISFLFDPAWTRRIAMASTLHNIQQVLARLSAL